jgi:hypothetical protein
MKSTNPGTPPASASTRLAALAEKKPPTKSAQIRRFWPEIRTALDNGHSLKAICECLEADGIIVSVRALGSYITRMRRQPDSAPRNPPRPVPTAAGGEGSTGADLLRRAGKEAEGAAQDPLANVRRSQAKRPRFEYRPELADPNKLI